jgi:Arc/MetJ-type ribon-helix-helix transcriptional regulator
VSDDRIVRVPLPVELIRRMDELVLGGKAGFQTRAEFIREAVEAMALELSYEPAPDEPLAQDMAGSGGSSVRHLAAPDHGGVHARALEAPAIDLKATILRSPVPGVTIDDGVGHVVDEPLFGLHNRDYPSIWAAHHLAALTTRELVGLSQFYGSVVKAAWEFGEQLLGLEKATAVKLSALFPTNRKKPQSAEAAFRMFAVGTRLAGGPEVRVSGPLFAWRICQVTTEGDGLKIGLTSEGRDLLTTLDGLSLELPHPPVMALSFFVHLRTHAPMDWWGFATLLETVEVGVTRNELVQAFQVAQPDWSDNVSTTNAAGYVARAREWGLVEPRLVEGHYALTPFGKQLLHEEKGDA